MDVPAQVVMRLGYIDPGDPKHVNNYLLVTIRLLTKLGKTCMTLSNKPWGILSEVHSYQAKYYGQVRTYP